MKAGGRRMREGRTTMVLMVIHCLPCGRLTKLIPELHVWGLRNPLQSEEDEDVGRRVRSLSFFFVFLLCISPRRRPQTGRVTQLTPCWPPHAQSGLISRHAEQSLATEAAPHTTADARGCPLCLHGWAEETNPGKAGPSGWAVGV